MNHDRKQPDAMENEQALLAHFRVHADGQPSAELDERILGAAYAAARDARQADSATGWGQGLHRWLFGPSRQRWSVALAGVACLGIGVSLAWRTQEQAPDVYDAVPPSVAMVPMAARSAPQSAPMAEAQVAAQPQEMQRQAKLAAPASAVAPVALADYAGGSAELAPLARMVSKAEPREALLQLLALRRAGEVEQAKQLQEQLADDFPHLDIEAELVHMAREH